MEGGHIQVDEVPRDEPEEWDQQLSWDLDETRGSVRLGYQACCGGKVWSDLALTVQDLDGTPPAEIVASGTLELSGEAGTPYAGGRARAIVHRGAPDGPTGDCGAGDGLQTSPSMLILLEGAVQSDEICFLPSERVQSQLRAGPDGWTVTETRTQVHTDGCGGDPGPDGPTRTRLRRIDVGPAGFDEACPAP